MRLNHFRRETPRKTGISIRTGVLIAIGLAAGLVIAWALFTTPTHWANQPLAWIVTMQAELHRQLTQAMRAAAAQDGWLAAMPLIGLSFLYGVFHAAGPGHGKAVMATYLGTSRERLSRGLLLSTLAALIQGLTAIVLVELFVNLLGFSFRQTQRAGVRLESVSFALVAALGILLAAKGAVALYRRWRHPPRPPASGRLFSGSARMRAYCPDCGALHDLAAARPGPPLRWRTGLSIALAIGIRPCAGALLVLLVAHAMESRWTGIAAVMAMSIGTAITVGMIAAGTLSVKAGFIRVAARRRHLDRLHVMFDILGLLGGALICVLGLGLLQHALQTQTHPLL